MGFDYEILYKQGHENNATYALSRVEGNPTHDVLSILQARI